MATACPAGTYQPHAGAASIDECLVCPPGHTCEKEATVVPKPCPPNMLCPASSQAPLPCPPGHYCPTPIEAVACPPGYYCSGAAETDGSIVACPIGTYCEARSAAPTPCPAGTRSLTEREGVFPGGRTSEAQACSPCPVGTFAPAGDASGQCQPCEAGYICTGRSPSSRPTSLDPATYTGGYICPRGYYCPAGAQAPIACPAGTYNKRMGATSEADCLQCPENTFAHRPGSTSCQSCGITATSKPGSSSCQCLRRGRTFSVASRSCPCQGGYELATSASNNLLGWWQGRDSSAETSETLDRNSLLVQSSYDCTPITFRRCTSGETRLSSGECIAKSEVSKRCEAICKGPNHVFDDSLGLCICTDEARFFERICDADCRARAPTVYFVPSNPISGEKSDVAEVAPPTKAENVANRLRQLQVGPLAMEAASVIAGEDDTPAVQDSTQISGTFIVTIPAAVENIVQTFSIPVASVGEMIAGALDCPRTPSKSPNSSLDAALPQNACLLHLASASGAGIEPLFGLPRPFVKIVEKLAKNPSVLSLRSNTEATQLLASINNLQSSVPPLRVAGPRANFDAAEKNAGFSTASNEFSTQDTIYGVLPAVFCLIQNEAMLFEIRPQAESYPVYDSASTLNTVAFPDESVFANIPTLYPSNSPEEFVIFGYTFQNPGVYVFYDHANPDAYTIITVLTSSETCPTGYAGSRASTITSAQLAKLGISGSSGTSITKAPNWDLVAVLLGLFFAIVFIVILVFWGLTNNTWGIINAPVPVYRKEAQSNDLDVWSFSTKGTVTTIESRSHGTQKLELSRDDLREEARAKGDKQMLRRLKYLHRAEDPKLTEEERRKLYELANMTSYEEIDFNSLFKKIDGTNKAMREYFQRQNELSHAYHMKTEQDLDNLKALLSIKMTVQMKSTGEGFCEAVDNLVANELIARGAFEEIYGRNAAQIASLLEEVGNRIAAISIDCNILPIMATLKELHEVIVRSEQRIVQERNRRRVFASHVELVGENIIRKLIEVDKREAEIIDEYWHTLRYFDGQVQEIRSTMMARESAYLSTMEAITNEEDRKTEQMQFHRAMVELVRMIQGELINFLERVKGYDAEIQTRVDESHAVLVDIQSIYLPKRLNELRNPPQGRLFRGINPDLAKVLTGLIGMLRSGIRINPKTHCYEPRAPFDPADPFQTITDPGEVYREYYNKQLELKIKEMEEAAEEARRMEEEERRMQLEQAQREAEERLRETEARIEAQRRELEEHLQTSHNDALLEDLHKQVSHDKDAKAVADNLQREQQELLASLIAKRDEIANDHSIPADERERQVKAWNEKIAVLENILKDEAISLIANIKDDVASSEEQVEAVAEEIDPDLAPSIKELELQAQLHHVTAELENLRQQLYASARLASLVEQLEDSKRDGTPVIAGVIPLEGATKDEVDLAKAEEAVLKREEAIAEFQSRNADKLRQLEDIIKKRRQQKLMGELASLDEDEDVLGLDPADRELLRAQELHESELQAAKERLQDKIRQIQDRHNAKRLALEKAEERERALKQELIEGDEEDETLLDDNTLQLRRKRIEDAQRQRRAAELARLEEEKARKLQQVSDQEEAQRLVKEYERNRLNLLKDLNAEEQAQRAQFEAALRRREEARRQKLLRATETAEQREARHKREEQEKQQKVAQMVASGVNAEDATRIVEAAAARREIIWERDPTDEELQKFSREEREAYMQRKAEREAAQRELLEKRKEARRRRLEAEEKKELEQQKLREVERLNRVRLDLEQDAQEELLREELEVETKAVVEEALMLAGVSVWEEFARHARKKTVTQRLQMEQQQRLENKEADEEFARAEARRLLTEASKEGEALAEQLEAELARQTKLLQEKLAQKNKMNKAAMREERERKKQEAQKRFEDAQKHAELDAELKVVQKLLSHLPEEQRQKEARKVLEAELHHRQAKEKRDMLAAQSAERRLFWKDELLKDENADPEKVQLLASQKFDKIHQKQLEDLEKRHAEEIKMAFLRLFPDADVSGPEWSTVDAGKNALEELTRKRQALLDEEKRKREEEFERKKKELEENERKLEEENRRRLAELQSKKASDEAEFTKMLNDHEQQLKKNHRLLLERKQAALDAELAANHEQTEEERKRMIQQHQEEMNRLEAALKDEFARQKKITIQKLQARRAQQQQRRADEERRQREEARRKRNDQAIAKAVDQNILGAQPASSTVVPGATAVGVAAAVAAPTTPGVPSAGVAAGAATPVVVTASASAPAKRMSTSAAGGATPASGPAGMAGAAPGVASGVSQADRAARQQELELKAKALEMRAKQEQEELEVRERIASKLAALEEHVVELDKATAQWHESYYVDEKEASIRPVRAPRNEVSDNAPHMLPFKPEPKPLSSMSAREFVLYRFATSFIRMLTAQGLFAPPSPAREGKSDELVLMITTGLPESHAKRTCFPNSSMYDPVSHTLWIRHERMSEPGELIFVLLHALAHIHTAAPDSSRIENWDDRAPKFLAHFYMLLRILASEMFFARSARALRLFGEPTEVPLPQQPAPTSSKSGSDSTSVEEVELWDSDTNASLLPTTFEPRIPKFKAFDLVTVDFAKEIQNPNTKITLAVDDLIDMHVALIDQSVHNHELQSRNMAGNGNPFRAAAPAVLGASNGMEYFTTREMLKRMESYNAFSASSRLRKFLVKVEQQAAGYDRTREKLAQNDFRGHGKVDERVASRKNIMEMSVESDYDYVKVNELDLSDLADELNRQLMAVVDQTYEASVRLQRLQQRSEDPNLSIARRTEISEKLAAERVIIARLDRERQVLLQRIAHLEGTDLPNIQAQKERGLALRGFIEDAKQKKAAAGYEKEEPELEF